MDHSRSCAHCLFSLEFNHRILDLWCLRMVFCNSLFDCGLSQFQNHIDWPLFCCFFRINSSLPSFLSQCSYYSSCYMSFWRFFRSFEMYCRQILICLFLYYSLKNPFPYGMELSRLLHFHCLILAATAKHPSEPLDFVWRIPSYCSNLDLLELWSWFSVFPLLYPSIFFLLIPLHSIRQTASVVLSHALVCL